MTLKDKLLTYLGFCPRKESAKDFRVRNNTITLKQSVVVVGLVLILILLVGASNIYASAVTIDTILRLFFIIGSGLILAIIIVGGLIVITRQFGRDPWALAKRTFLGTFLLVLLWGSTQGFFFISPTDGWVEIITESLAISLISTVVMVIGAAAYSRWRKGK